MRILNKYNSQLPFPKFDLGLPENKDNYTEPVLEQKNININKHEEIKKSNVSHQHKTTNLKPLDDDFDDFIDPSANQDFVEQEPPKPAISEEEKQRLEMEERIKRFELLSSAFEDVLVEETKPQIQSNLQVNSKVVQNINNSSSIIQNQNENKSSNSNSTHQENDWDDFAFAENSTPSQDMNLNQDRDLLNHELPQQNEPDKMQNANNDSFEDFAEPQTDESQNEEVSLGEKIKSKETSKPNKAELIDEFPSFFDANITPRVNNEMTDIRMSFPSQEMWSTSLATKASDNSKSKDDNKIDWDSEGQGFESSNFKFGQTHGTINEEDEFSDIMKLKDEVSAKEKKLDDSFEEFTDAKETHPQVEEKKEIKKLKPLPLKLNKSSAKDDPNKWGSFKFEEVNDNKDKLLENSTWTNKSETVLCTNKPNNSNPKLTGVIDFEDPFAEIDIQPAAENFDASNNSNKNENVNVNKESQKDEDSDFDDFIEPSESKQDEESSQSSQNSIPTKLVSENNDFESKPNFFIKSLPNPKKIEEEIKAFEESDFLGGFIKTISHSDSNKHVPQSSEQNKEIKTESKKSMLMHVDQESKNALMSQIARCFGDSESIDFGHLPESPQISIDLNTLNSKIEDITYMKQVSDTVIKLENYEGAMKIIDHINTIQKIEKNTIEKNKAAAEEQYEVAKSLRDEIISLREKLIKPETILSFVNVNNDHKQPTLKSLLNQVLYRVDDCIAKYFIPKVIERFNSIGEQDFDRKIIIHFYNMFYQV